MIIVDGRTDQEKLGELLQQPEQTHLEFKLLLDLQDKRDKLNFVKDAVAMANRPPGGYILVGVEDNGTPALPIGTISDRSLFDGARLGDMIRRYIDAEIHVISQFHAVNGHEIVVIYLPHHRAGLPVPMSKNGQYKNTSGKTVAVFREGDIFVREGAQNTPIRYAHWNDLLSRLDQRLREQTRVQVDSLISDLAVALREGGISGSDLVPLTVEMANSAFSEAVISHLESDDDIRLRQFIGKAAALISSAAEQDNALEKLTILTAQALYFERDVVARTVIDKLFSMYTSIGDSDPVTLLAIITRLYVLGSLAVRLHQWGVMRDLVLRPYQSNSGTYTYSSWIRHGQVTASRNNLFSKNKRRMRTSDARKLMSENADLRRDVPESGVRRSEDRTDDDILLNSLCQFDILYCSIVETQGEHRAGAYPAAPALHQYRSDPAFELVATDMKARADMFPDISEKQIAESISLVFEGAKRESFNFGGYWSSLPIAAEQFTSEHIDNHE